MRADTHESVRYPLTFYMKSGILLLDVYKNLQARCFAVLLAPMPSASMSTTVTVNPGFAASDRTASRKSAKLFP